MYIDIKTLALKYNMNINGVIHIGGHVGEEYKTYIDLGIKKQIWFEPLQTSFDTLVENVCNYKIDSTNIYKHIHNSMYDGKQDNNTGFRGPKEKTAYSCC